MDSLETTQAKQFFYAEAFEGDEYIFDTFESRHLIKVLRKKTGDIIFFTNGLGKLFKAEIQIVTKNKVKARILETEFVPEPEKKLHVLIAPTKSIERFEWFLEKATELGVWEITPVITKFTERKKLNRERLEKIIISAVKQSKRAYKPKLNCPQIPEEIDFTETVFVSLCKTRENYIKEFSESKNAAIIIGPEGGFSIEEIKMFKEKKFPPVQLSQHRLRTETAGITAVCLFNTKK